MPYTEVTSRRCHGRLFNITYVAESVGAMESFLDDPGKMYGRGNFKARK
jgi:hypothetical protein